MRPQLRAFLLAFNVYTLFVWGWLVVEFFFRNVQHVPTSVTTVYVTVLSFYVGDKEIERLRKRYASRNVHGERFVLLWVATLIAMSTLVVFNRTAFHIPTDLPVVTASVLFLWLVSEYVKKRHRHR